jgi:MFS family permease
LDKSGVAVRTELNPDSARATATSFVVLFCIVGIALWSLPFYYDFMVKQYESRAQVTSGNALSKLILGPAFFNGRGTAMGIAYLGIGLGGAAVPLISHALTQHMSWQAALKVLGAGMVAVALPMAFFVKEPVEAPAVSSTPNGTKTGAFKTLAFYLLIAGSMCSIAAVSGTQQNLKLFLSLDLHYTQGATGRILSLVLAFSIVGRLLMGWLADRFPKKYVMLLIYLLVAGAIPFLFAGKTESAIYVFAVIFGIGLGGDYMIIPLMTAELFGLQAMGRLLGVILTADGVAEAVAPWWLARLRDASGSYVNGFVTLIGAAVWGAVAIVMLPKRGSAQSQ